MTLSTLSKSKIVIIGAGPAGATLSLYLCKAKIPHVLIDKAKFPRDKTCGDALTPEVLRVIRELNEEWYQELIRAPWLQSSSSLKVETYRGQKIHLAFKNGNQKTPFWFVSEREKFDNWLLDKIDPTYATIMLECEVTLIEKKGSHVHIDAIQGADKMEFDTPLVIGADGERSVVRKFFHPQGIKKNKKHHAGSIRQYWTNVTNNQPELPLEFYVPVKGKTYLWIFHLPDGKANVGIGAMSDTLSKEKINLKKVMHEFLRTHPSCKDRFQNATPLENPKGWGIPFNSDAFGYSGDNFILIGDSAKFAEPLTGKGIGIAMLGSKYAFPVIKEAVDKKDFSKDQMLKYEEAVEGALRKEWKMLHRMQKLAEKPFLMELLVSIVNFKPVRRIIEKNLVKSYIAYLEKPLSKKES